MKATAICLLLCVIGASTLSAHPFDDRVDMIVELYLLRDAKTDAEGMRLEVLYFYDGPFTSYVELQELDLNKDERITRTERDARYRVLAADLMQALQIRIYDERVTLKPRYEHFEFVDLNSPDNTIDQPGGMPVKDTRIGYTFKFDIEMATPWDRGEHPVEMVLADRRIFIAQPSEQLRVFDDRGPRRAAFFNRNFDRTPKPDEFQRMTFMWEVGTFTQGSAPKPADEPAKDDPQSDQASRDKMVQMYDERRDTESVESRAESLVRSLRDNTASPFVWLSVLLAMFGLGAYHAVMPGHGKTLVASYLIGTQGTRTDALFLGVVVTAAHTSGVMLLLAFGWAASEFWPGVFKNPEQQMAEWISLAVGATILLMGAVLVIKRAGGGGHAHDLFGRHIDPNDDHHHDHDHHHSHTHAAHEKAPDDSDPLLQPVHDHHHRDPARMTRMEILWLGILGGILPCPTAFVVGLIAFRSQMYASGLIMVLVFSLGLAVVLAAIGLVLVQGKSYLHARGRQGKRRLYRALETKLPVFGALVITTIGVAMVLLSLIRLNLIDPRSFTV